MKKSWHFSQS